MFLPDLSRWGATRRSQSLLRRLLPALAALLLLIGLGGYLLVTNALSQDADVQQRARTFIARTLEQARDEVGRNLINYAKWGEAYRHLHLKVDRAWADAQRNVGDVPYDLYGYNGVLVVNGQGRTVYAVIDGQPATLRAQDWVQGDLDSLLAEARTPQMADTSIVRALQVDGTPALVAAGTITPGWSVGLPSAPGPASVMLFVSVLDAGKLAHMSQTYGLPLLTASATPLAGQQSMDLLDSAMQLNWSPPQPGRALLGQTLPLFAAGVLLLAAVLAWLLRHALASARQIDAQFAALHTSQAELRSSEQRFRDMAEASSDWLWEVDAQGRLTYLSERFTAVTQRPREAWLGRPLAELLVPQQGALLPWLQQAGSADGAAGGAQERESLLCHYQDQDGGPRVGRITARRMLGADGRAAGHRGTATDITDEVAAQAAVRHLSLHDSLTGLPNRLQLQQALDHQLGPAGRPALAVLCLDLDRFKPVNDALGHAAGDRVLQEVACRLRTQVPPQALVARLGGDEFVVLLPGTAEEGPLLAQAEALSAVLVQALCQPVALPDLGELQAPVVTLGASIGIALAPRHAQDADALLRCGDLALYAAKAAGRNTWRSYTPTMRAYGAQALEVVGQPQR